ncbi:hypothetical protein FALBO_3622 [Fusarium albosuccineum]|uniref:Uncharacterized protein n=1 Tax=Fusarium albosuccineum TaxID=1237068 RepID=A0A8H4PH14_9HYPO|nr:hypothetical protein FALBO_3622 [Fusarium albosuccineum]
MPTIAVPTCLPPTKSGTSSRETSVTTGSQSLTVTSEKDCHDLFLQEVSALPEREPVTSTTTSPTETRMTTMPPTWSIDRFCGWYEQLRSTANALEGTSPKELDDMRIMPSDAEKSRRSDKSPFVVTGQHWRDKPGPSMTWGERSKLGGRCRLSRSLESERRYGEHQNATPTSTSIGGLLMILMAHMERIETVHHVDVVIKLES